MRRGDIVRITKMAACENPHHETATRDEYDQGNFNRKSPFVDYTLEGIVEVMPIVGRSVEVLRTKRNGMVSAGYFRSSIVEKITDEGFTTKNSVYKMEVL